MHKLSVAALLLTSCVTVPATAAQPPAFSIQNVTVPEGIGTALMTVQKSGATRSSSTIRVSETDQTGKMGTDYKSVTGTITFGSGANIATFRIPIIDNSVHQDNRTFLVNISPVTNAQISQSPAIVTIQDDDPPPPPVVTQPPPPVPSTSVKVGDITPIASSFDYNLGIQQNTWVPAIAPPSPDDMGNFRMICGAGQILYDDPIVYPGQPGKSHLHQFFGALGVTAASTYASMRTGSQYTNCGDPTSPYAVNASGYWMPAMLDGAGNVVRPLYVAIYYKRQPANSPYCTPGDPNFIGICTGVPTGISFITGYNMSTNTYGDSHPFYYCQDSDPDPATGIVAAHAISGALQDNMAQVVPLCPVGARLTLNLAGPDCWDGINLDVPDHRSHVAHGAYLYDPSQGKAIYRCDAAHPYHMPQISIMAFYNVDANFEAGLWHLSCDKMAGTAPGVCFHTDYKEAWEPAVRAMWEKNCMDGHEQCAGGDLGNGYSIKGMGLKNDSALIPIPPNPNGDIAQ